MVDFVDGTLASGRSVVIHCRTGTFQAATVAALWLARSQWHSPADALDAVSAAVVSFEFVIRDIISGSAPDSFPDYFGCCLAF